MQLVYRSCYQGNLICHSIIKVMSRRVTYLIVTLTRWSFRSILCWKRLDSLVCRHGNRLFLAVTIKARTCTIPSAGPTHSILMRSVYLSVHCSRILSFTRGSRYFSWEFPFRNLCVSFTVFIWNKLPSCHNTVDLQHQTVSDEGVTLLCD
jgi:hypothetical protein